MVAGSMTDAVETHDVWTFARTLKSTRSELEARRHRRGVMRDAVGGDRTVARALAAGRRAAGGWCRREARVAAAGRAAMIAPAARPPAGNPDRRRHGGDRWRARRRPTRWPPESIAGPADWRRCRSATTRRARGAGGVPDVVHVAACGATDPSGLTRGRIGSRPAPRRQAPATGDAARLLRAPVRSGAGRRRQGVRDRLLRARDRGSRERRGGYETPIYARPDDLIDVDLGQFSDRPEGQEDPRAGRADAISCPITTAPRSRRGR